MSGGADWEQCDCSTVREVISGWVTSEKRSGGTERENSWIPGGGASQAERTASLQRS